MVRTKKELLSMARYLRDQVKDGNYDMAADTARRLAGDLYDKNRDEARKGR